MTRAAAYHEAGHAVIALLLGHTVEYVTISRGRPPTGETKIVFRTLSTETLGEYVALCGRVMSGLAGSVAQARAMHVRLADVLSDTGGGRKDLSHVKEVLALMSQYSEAWLAAGIQPLYPADLDHWLKMTRLQVRTNWPVIERVAGGLLERGRLDGAAVLDLACAQADDPETLVSDRAELHCTGVSDASLP